jgi:hypothetical protein
MEGRTVLTFGRTIAVLAVIALFWMGCEIHKQICVDEHHVACTMIPWKSGHPESKFDPVTGLPYAP